MLLQAVQAGMDSNQGQAASPGAASAQARFLLLRKRRADALRDVDRLGAGPLGNDRGGGADQTIAQGLEGGRRRGAGAQIPQGYEQGVVRVVQQVDDPPIQAPTESETG